MGGIDWTDLIRIFLATNVPNPTIHQLREAVTLPGKSYCYNPTVESLKGGYTGLVVLEGDCYRLDSRIIARGLEKARQELEFWQKYVIKLEELEKVKTGS